MKGSPRPNVIMRAGPKTKKFGVGRSNPATAGFYPIFLPGASIVYYRIVKIIELGDSPRGSELMSVRAQRLKVCSGLAQIEDLRFTLA
jgi:hypothetical protein